jgi:hypothetical protein
MLLEKTKFKKGDIISIKLISGEEIIGKYIGEDMTDLVIHNPKILAITQKGPAMAPVMMTVEPDNDYSISKSAIILKGYTEKEIADQYTYQTTGIQPVSAGGVFTG